MREGFPPLGGAALDALRHPKAPAQAATHDTESCDLEGSRQTLGNFIHHKAGIR